jgi:hypothetical protein
VPALWGLHCVVSCILLCCGCDTPSSLVCMCPAFSFSAPAVALRVFRGGGSPLIAVACGWACWGALRAAQLAAMCRCLLLLFALEWEGVQELLRHTQPQVHQQLQACWRVVMRCISSVSMSKRWGSSAEHTQHVACFRFFFRCVVVVCCQQYLAAAAILCRCLSVGAYTSLLDKHACQQFECFHAACTPGC